MSVDRGYQGKIESLTARMAAALVLLKHLRGANIDHAAACYRRGRADGTGMPTTARAEQVTVREANDKVSRLNAQIVEALTLPAVTVTPAEARTGISDRNAAALADVANLRYGLKSGRMDWTPELDRIEQALRAGGAA